MYKFLAEKQKERSGSHHKINQILKNSSSKISNKKRRKLLGAVKGPMHARCLYLCKIAVKTPHK